MKTTVRFENAVSKLYKAFHEGKLDSGSCSACAVGNICDRNPMWEIAGGFFSAKQANGSRLEYAMKVINHTGYSREELNEVERIFIKAVKWRETKRFHFKGLCAVVEYLAELDGIPNPMDYKALFETENDKPKLELSSVF